MAKNNFQGIAPCGVVRHGKWRGTRCTPDYCHPRTTPTTACSVEQVGNFLDLSLLVHSNIHTTSYFDHTQLLRRQGSTTTTMLQDSSSSSSFCNLVSQVYSLLWEQHFGYTDNRALERLTTARNEAWTQIVTRSRGVQEEEQRLLVTSLVQRLVTQQQQQ